jgi:hypothetical protein
LDDAITAFPTVIERGTLVNPSLLRLRGVLLSGISEAPTIRFYGRGYRRNPDGSFSDSEGRKVDAARVLRPAFRPPASTYDPFFGPRRGREQPSQFDEMLWEKKS